MSEKRNVLIGFGIVIILSLFSFYFMSQEKTNFDKQYFQVANLLTLTDDYSSEDLFNQPNSLERLKTFNQELKTNEMITFIEFAPNVVEFIGEWNKPAELVNGYGHVDLMNQTITRRGEELLITPVNCISLDQQSLDLYSLTLSEGEWFSLNDFNPETYELPLILGAGFKDYYSIGDEMSLLYFGRNRQVL